ASTVCAATVVQWWHSTATQEQGTVYSCIVANIVAIVSSSSLDAALTFSCLHVSNDYY
ncbi:Hypothetical predicted protein, partial [Olea europaea subsp. europaea]